MSPWNFKAITIQFISSPEAQAIDRETNEKQKLRTEVYFIPWEYIFPLPNFRCSPGAGDGSHNNDRTAFNFV